MESYIETPYNHHQHRPENRHESNDEQQQNSGLLRYRSAPSSLFFEYTQNLSDQNGCSELYETKPQGLGNSTQSGYTSTGSGSGTSTGLELLSQLPPQYPKQQSGVSTTSTSIMEKSLEISGGSLRRVNHGDGFNLNRQSSSPAGFFSQLNTQNGYTIGRGLGSFRVGNNGTNGESSPRTSRLGMNPLPRIPEIGNENIKETSPDEVKFGNHEGEPGFDGPAGYSFATWSDSSSEASLLSENGGILNRPTMLTHHMSLPKTSTEMAAIEKLLHFQDTVPCKVRAKRGCATHPRSIAERERRNRISERMRKLQELVPNMDTQTNISDMLDLAVDYVKKLQDEFKALTDDRAKCKCINLQ